TISRNFYIKLPLGQGISASELLRDRRTDAEGEFTAPQLARLARTRGIDMPIVAAVEQLLSGAGVGSVLEDLLSRPPRAEGI
ncbi:MAG: glycerol-3-phosphate dehydrogenase, partial [Pseudomonadota bacterium]|nr:glycerol-3-phosphate dehydrogenase [Pseudomonadota bacterium]